MKKLAAEFVGTFWLVLGGCGSAVLAAAFPDVGIGLLGVSLAFGLTVLTMAYAIGHISGCHLNPAVSVGLWAGGRFSASELPGYIAAQVAGAIVAGGVLYLIASGIAMFLGLMSKENAITFLAVIPLTMYFFTNAKRKDYIVALTPSFIAAVTYMIIRTNVIGYVLSSGKV